jgi:hypothetical protein
VVALGILVEMLSIRLSGQSATLTQRSISMSTGLLGKIEQATKAEPVNELKHVTGSLIKVPAGDGTFWLLGSYSDIYNISRRIHTLEKSLAMAKIRVGFRHTALVNRLNSNVLVLADTGERRRITDSNTAKGKQWRDVSNNTGGFTTPLQALHIFEDGIINKQLHTTLPELSHDKAPCFLASAELHLRKWTYPAEVQNSRNNVRNKLGNKERLDAIKAASTFFQGQYRDIRCHGLLNRIAIAVTIIATALIEEQ